MKTRAFSTVEMVIVMLIVVTLGAVFLITMSGSKTGDAIDRAVQSIYNDMLFIRSRAVSTNRDHRLNFIAANEWYVQAKNPTNGAWEQVGDIRRMPGDINMASGSSPGGLANAAGNLQASPRGLFTFLNNASGLPYATITGYGTSKTKSIYAFVGGAIEIKTP